MSMFKEVPIGTMFYTGFAEDGEGAEGRHFRKVSETEAVQRYAKWRYSKRKKKDVFLGFAFYPSRIRFKPKHPVYLVT